MSNPFIYCNMNHGLHSPLATFPSSDKLPIRPKLSHRDSDYLKLLSYGLQYEAVHHLEFGRSGQVTRPDRFVIVHSDEGFRHEARAQRIIQNGFIFHGPTRRLDPTAL